MNYKDTLRMLNTQFEMRANLAQREPVMLEKWKTRDLYNNLLKKNEGQESFVLHDGPPYANGNLHSGTAMNRVLKDFIVRSKAMNRFYTPFIPGWDTHGLPIENAVIKLGVNRKEVEPAFFRTECKNYALTQIAIQKETMKRLGTVGDFENPYITLTNDFEANQIKSFAQMALKGLIYQGLKPVYWSYASESALAESEIVYQDKKDPAIFVAFDVKDGKGVLTNNERFVIWTTTPWTIPANLAITLHANFEYAVVKTSKGNLVVLKKHVDSLMKEFDIEEYEILKTYKGKELEYITVYHPLYSDKESLVILGDHVTDEDGTGCVHTAPGHGLDDYYVGLKYNLEPYCPVDEKGHMTKEAGELLEGQFIEKASKTVTVALDESGHLIKMNWITHSYPYDERMKNPVIFRATVQWFTSFDTIRPQLLEQIKKVNWENEWGEVRLYNMIKDRGDWCISRQRLWGLPIPIIYAEDKTPILEEEVFAHIEKLFREHGSNVWFDREAKDLLPEGYTHPLSPNGIFTKEKDILDVWFDSGSSHNVLLERGIGYPADLYFEGSDQYRGWFNSSLIVGYTTKGQAPYKSVLSHGYVLDAKGNKMSKSVGNTIDPLDVIKTYGADVFRLWCANIDYKQDVRIGDEVLKQASDQYRKIRNTFRFMLGNLGENDFDYTKDLLEYNDLELVDQHILVLLNRVNKKVIKAYDKYDFLGASSTMSIFMTNELSAYYFDFTKDILYIEKQDSKRRRQVQSVIWYTLQTLLRLWAPILVFTTEEVYEFVKKDDAIIHDLHFATINEYNNEDELVAKFNKLFEVRSDVLKALEELRQLKQLSKSLEAHVYLSVEDSVKDDLTMLFGDNIHQWLGVSTVSLSLHDDAKEYKASKIKIEKAQGTQCPRCWNITHSHKEDGLCDRCASVLGLD